MRKSSIGSVLLVVSKTYLWSKSFVEIDLSPSFDSKYQSLWPRNKHEREDCPQKRSLMNDGLMMLQNSVICLTALQVSPHNEQKTRNSFFLW